ncbi:type II secretion system minor pseudopilin GspH [Alkalilimnicola sp. S0819]|uniref:type II secretion system minor pseudopilin GspH n=1 Tax=Alkalilimnicola sp. S0819 TaxID=2613922 RepID=UPI001261C50D|nr:type II secretion system minor pseudopilin GspH [Alkalilimnicola sp. S0819]KAB7622992.1 type II secretion system protein GspH [Alkalilimnicola sp. S0819]MPQ17102.1 type II secretion system protein GspH [Alkalilimnicola sp. S0819]
MPSARHPDTLKPPPRGFTLMEVMVVLVLIGIITSMAVIGFGGGRADSLQEESRRLAVLMQLASEEAILTARPLGLRFDEEGYRFLQYEEQRWRVLEEDPQLRPRALPEFLRLELLLEGQSAEPAGLLAQGEEDEDRLLPEILFMETGELTPFELLIRAEEVEDHYRISGDINGVLDLQSRGE